MGKSILISRFSALGDVAMTIPVVYDACLSNPDDTFYFLTKRHQAQLFVNAPSNLHIISIDPANYPGARGMLRLALSLKKRYGINLYLDLHDVLRTKLLRTIFPLLGVRTYCIRKGRASKRRLTREHHKVLIQLKPTIERYRDVFMRAGVSLTHPVNSIYGSSKGNPEEFSQVTPPKQATEYWLAIAPFAQHRGKIYPLELMGQVVDKLSTLPNIKIFIFGFGDKEEKGIEEMRQDRGNIINMASAKIGMSGELSLLSHCDTMLSMDSANMHLASLVGLRAVSIWGATHPYTGFLGAGQKIEDCVQLEMTCRPCSVYGNKPCMRGDYFCMSGITPQMIIQRLQIPSRMP